MNETSLKMIIIFDKILIEDENYSQDELKGRGFYMVLLLVILTAAAYSLVMKYVLNNVFVTRSGSAAASKGGLGEEKKPTELVPAYNRQ
jgi:hypothetical protein